MSPKRSFVNEKKQALTYSLELLPMNSNMSTGADNHPPVISHQYPAVSVIIPTYDRCGFLRQAIESVLAQTCPADELIVVDDGSTDDTPDMLADYGNRIRVIRQSNRGVSAARNTGIRQSRGQFIALLDSDDYWLPQKLAAQQSFFKGHLALPSF